MRIPTGSGIRDAIGAAIGRTDFTVADARSEPLEYDAFLAHRSVNRIRGTAISGGERIAWRIIEKVTEGPHLAIPYLVDNARREYAAYTSGVLHDLAPGLRAPRLLASASDDSGRVALWMEDLPAVTPRPLDSETLLAVSRDLGALAGSWVGRVPTHSWLFTGWIDRHTQPEAFVTGLADLSRETETVAGLLGSRRAGAIRLLHAQPQVRQVLESLPQTLCHHDAVGANVFRADGMTVLIDWESVGVGPVGADLASLLFSSVRRGDCSARLAASLVDEAVEAYAAGVATQAEHVDSATTRRGFDAAVALRWKLVRDIADSVERGIPIRRGSLPGETSDDALSELLVLSDLLLECAGRALNW